MPTYRLSLGIELGAPNDVDKRFGDLLFAFGVRANIKDAFGFAYRLGYKHPYSGPGYWVKEWFHNKKLPQVGDGDWKKLETWITQFDAKYPGRLTKGQDYSPVDFLRRALKNEHAQKPEVYFGRKVGDVEESGASFGQLLRLYAGRAGCKDRLELAKAMGFPNPKRAATFITWWFQDQSLPIFDSDHWKAIATWARNQEAHVLTKNNENNPVDMLTQALQREHEKNLRRQRKVLRPIAVKIEEERNATLITELPHPKPTTKRPATGKEKTMRPELERPRTVISPQPMRRMETPEAEFLPLAIRAPLTR